MKVVFRSALIVGMSVTSVLLAEAVIGVASTRGTMEVNDATVRGNANVLEGCSIRTNETASQVSLRLAEGSAQVTIKDSFDIEALAFHVAPDKSRAVARVVYDTPNRVLISAVSGPLKVSNEDGVFLARVAAGTTYFFEQDPAQDQTAASAGKRNTGKGSSAGKTAKTGMSAGAKWGVVAGVAAAGAGVGLGVGLSGGNTSR